MDKTTEEVLKVVEKLNFKGFVQDFHKNANGDYNHLHNFFIWKRKNKAHEYLRITLTSEGLPYGENYYLFWNLETSFKPFAYKHNHRENANIQSERFKEGDRGKYTHEFLKIVERAKKETKWHT